MNDLMNCLNILSSREWATIIWLLILLIYILKNEKIKDAFLNVIKILFGKNLIKIWLVTSLYVFIITFLFSKTAIWDNLYIKDIIVWFITSGIIFCFNAASKEADEQYIWKVLKDNLKFTIIIEFIYSTFTFRLWVELLIIPIITLLAMVDAYAERKEEYYIVHKFMQGVFVIISIWFFYETFKIGLQEYKELNILNTFVSFMIPIVYLILILPLEYIIELYCKYEILFVRLFFKNSKDKKVNRMRKLLIIKECGFSVHNVILFQKNYCSKIYIKMTDDDFKSLINDFNKEKKKSDKMTVV